MYRCKLFKIKVVVYNSGPKYPQFVEEDGNAIINSMWDDAWDLTGIIVSGVFAGVKAIGAEISGAKTVLEGVRGGLSKIVDNVWKAVTT